MQTELFEPHCPDKSEKTSPQSQQQICGYFLTVPLSLQCEKHREQNCNHTFLIQVHHNFQEHQLYMGLQKEGREWSGPARPHWC